MGNPSASRLYARPFRPAVLRRVLTGSAPRFAWLVWAAVVAALFFQLGEALLFEPDEGRNAEKAREILVLQDWLTPHENFHPVLDKPIFFYWLIAIAYKIFGVSEWAARMPSALAALGTLALVYRLARTRWGQWPALWTVLILLTSIEFFILARVVIFDMTLTFFVTAALCAFFEIRYSANPRLQWFWCVVLYASLGVATLIKGLIGLVIPGMVIFFDLALSGRWETLRKMAMLPGALLFFVIVVSWYLPVEIRNPGYLRYFVWEEHFGRFISEEFDRAEPWYYFIVVGFVGFLPWSVLLPVVGSRLWKDLAGRKLDRSTVYLVLWIVLPVVFFSLSRSKLPHYILPVFPALALLTGVALGRLYHDDPGRWRFALSLTWWVLVGLALFFLAGWFFPAVAPRHIRAAIGGMGLWAWLFAIVSIAMLAYTGRLTGRKPHPSQRQLYGLQMLCMGAFLAVAVKLIILLSPSRSAQPVVATLQTKLTPGAEVVFYDTYFAGGLFYLRSNAPLMLVTHEKKKQTFLGNFYVLGERADSPARASRTILSFEEFRNYWRADTRPLLIIVKEKNLGRMATNLGEMPAQVAAVGEYLLVAKPQKNSPSDSPALKSKWIN